MSAINAVVEPLTPMPPPAAFAKVVKNASYRHAHVLSTGAEGRRLWRFKVIKDTVGPMEETRLNLGKPLPAQWVGKGWNTLLSPALNVAWLSAEDVFLRVVPVAAGPLEEVIGLVELQLDKLSPLAPSQVVWSVELLPHPDRTQQTALVVIAPRARVEEYLGTLEKSGFVPDRLEVPFVGQLRQLPRDDGLWVLAEEGGTSTNLLLAWRVEGVIREVSLMTVPNGPGLTLALSAHLTRTNWAGELEGWLKDAPEVWLIAPASRREELETALSTWHGGLVHFQEPLSVEMRAAASATAQLRSAGASLVPAEIQARQRRQFVDRLWLQGLGAIGLMYLALVVFYLGLLNFKKWQLDTLQSNNSGLALQYTNTLATKAQMLILEEQVALRYAALDSWQAAIEKLPSTISLSTINFVKGRTLRLDGTVSTEAQPEVVNFHNELRKVTTTNGTPLFSGIKQGPIAARGNTVTWSLEAELNRTEAP